MNRVKLEIFKIQRPIASSSQILLIYNEDRSVYGNLPMSQELAGLMGTDYKIYVKGYVDDEGMLYIEEKVEPQLW